jgi:hypothetical protein
MGRVYLPSSEPLSEDEVAAAESLTPPGGRVYVPSSAPPPEQPQAEEVEAEEEQPEPEADESEQSDSEESELEQVLLEEPEPSPVGAQASHPPVRASKEDWVTYAQSQGWDGDPEEITKAELIERYGQD